MSSLYARIAEIEREGRAAAVVTVVRAVGSTPREPGARMLVLPDGSTEGTVGGGRVEQEAIQTALEVIADGRPRLVDHKLTQELGMCCGGQVSLFVEALGRAARLIVFGAGHVGAALTRAASSAGFAVHVADEREELLTEARLPDAKGLHGTLDDPALPFALDTCVMITTHDHALDHRLVEMVLKKPHRWLGLIGSRRKAEITRDRLRHKGFAEELIARVRCPVGLAIGAETPEEIAVSILGELIAERRGARIARDERGVVAEVETKRARGSG